MKKATTHLRQSDPVLGAIIDRVGRCRLTYRDPDFAYLVRAIIYQQLSGRVASVIHDRVVAGLNGRVTAAAILAHDPADLRSYGLSAQKISYLIDLAEKTRARVLRFPDLPKLTDAEVIERLTQVKGIGEWTAHMFLMFALRRPDILPTGDLGIRMAMQKAYQLTELPKPKEMLAIAAPWRPHASVATWYLWRSLEGDAEV